MNSLVRPHTSLLEEKLEQRSAIERAMAHLAAVVESSDDAIISKTLDGRILSWNAGAQHIFGYSAEEAVGQSINLIVPPDRLDEERHLLDALKRGGHVEQLETTRLAKDGRTIEVSITVSPVRDATGVVVGAAKVARDITERKHAEQSLRESERALRQVHQELKSRAVELARFNQAAVGREMRMIELKREVNEVLGEFGQDARYPLEFDAEPPPRSNPPSAPQSDGLVPLAAILRTHELDERPARPPDYETENRALTALVEALAKSTGTILQTLADELLDVLQAGSSGLSLLTETGEQFYWVAIAGAWQPHLGGGTPGDFGPCGDVLDCNTPLLFTHWERRYPYLAAATPLAEEGLLAPFHVGGKAVGTIWAISHDPHRQFDREDLRLLESLGRFASIAYQAMKLSGVNEQWRAALNLLEDAVHARQLTEDSNRKLQEREELLREADQRKNEFLALLGHELRNPLAPISSASELLSRMTWEDSRARRAIDVIKRQVSQLATLVNDLLDVARITQGRIQLRRMPIDLGSVIAEAIETVQPELRSNQHRIFVDTASCQPVYVDGDPTRLVQCVVNILSNAAKYTAPGGEVRIQTHVEDCTAIIEVSDTGVGIAPELLPRVFDLFVQSDRSLDRSQAGLGIGLAVVKRLIEMHGGQVVARSPGPGLGATFEIRLPRIARPERSRPEVAPFRAPPQRVLIVDDNVDAATSLATLLAFQGHETKAVYSGKDALGCIQSFKPDVAMLDIGLPGMNGYELAERLRAVTKLNALRLVALTGYGQSEDRQRALAAGFDDHLIKPVDLPALERSLAGISEPGSIFNRR